MLATTTDEGVVLLPGVCTLMLDMLGVALERAPPVSRSPGGGAEKSPRDISGTPARSVIPPSDPRCVWFPDTRDETQTVVPCERTGERTGERGGPADERLLEYLGTPPSLPDVGESLADVGESLVEVGESLVERCDLGLV